MQHSRLLWRRPSGDKKCLGYQVPVPSSRQSAYLHMHTKFFFTFKVHIPHGGDYPPSMEYVHVGKRSSGGERVGRPDSSLVDLIDRFAQL